MDGTNLTVDGTKLKQTRKPKNKQVRSCKNLTTQEINSDLEARECQPRGGAFAGKGQPLERQQLGVAFV